MEIIKDRQSRSGKVTTVLKSGMLLVGVAAVVAVARSKSVAVGVVVVVVGKGI